ncbi:MAG: hypothetical protein H7Y86_14055 [Rhizobacter sp.]|nr:hypothetical protein [Ferruginibacter sp.]
MKKVSSFLLMFYCSVFIISCSTPTPEKYFDVAVLNANMVVGFANNALSRELEMPSMKMMGSSDEPVLMTRQEIIENKISFSEKVLDDLKSMSRTSDANDIVTTSIAMHEFVIGVYETDYMELAKLYDEGAPKEKIAAFDQALKDKHASMFELHYDNLIRGGKLYASKHTIAVNWAM